MPAHRSRTANWRRCLAQIQERGGSIDIALDRGDGRSFDEEAVNVVWRVRLLGLTDDAILIEQPSALGRVVELHPGDGLVCVMAVGQNQWTFESVVEAVEGVAQNGRMQARLRIATPKSVRRRARRRSHDRISIGALVVPAVQVWPLLDPSSVGVAERANELHLDEVSRGVASDPDALTLPDVGPCFHADLMNLGGGGLGLRVSPEDRGVLSRYRTYWLRFTLPPESPAPICATTNLVHTHIDSSQCAYAGMAFDFSHNPDHEAVVARQIQQFVTGRIALSRRSA